MGSPENGFRFVAVSHADHPLPDNVMEAAVLWIDATEATTPVQPDELRDALRAHLMGIPHVANDTYSEFSWGAAGARRDCFQDRRLRPLGYPPGRETTRSSNASGPRLKDTSPLGEVLLEVLGNHDAPVTLLMVLQDRDQCAADRRGPAFQGDDACSLRALDLLAGVSSDPQLRSTPIPLLPATAGTTPHA
jgi:hypothetical protein